MSSLLQDVRFGLRGLWKNKRFSLLALLYLALGIGGNTIVFSIIRSTLSEPVAFENSERLVLIWDKYEPPDSEPRDDFYVCPVTYAARKTESRSFVGMSAYLPANLFLSGEGGEAEYLRGAKVSSDFLPLLGVEPILGRPIFAEEDRVGEPGRVALINFGLWQRRFGGDENAIGESLYLNGENYTVVGILPRDFHEPVFKPEVWIPLGFDLADTSLEQRKIGNLITIARLKPDVSLAKAQAELDIISDRLQQTYPDTHESWGANALMLQEYLVGDVRPHLLTIQLASAFVLLIGCANLANLVLVRADRWTQILAVQSALGASRGQLLQRVIVEHLLLTLLGAALGVLLAFWAVKNVGLLGALTAFSQSSQASSLVSTQKVQIDIQVLGFALVATVLTGLLFGVLPALKVSKVRLSKLLKGSGRSAGTLRGHRLLNTLVVLEIAFAVLLMIGAGLMLKSFQQLNAVDPGFETENAVLLRFKLPTHRYTETRTRTDFAQRALETARGLPGVSAAGITTTLPVTTDRYFLEFNIEGREPASQADILLERFGLVTPGYFEAMGIPLLEGRGLRLGDDEQAPGVVVVSKAMAQRYWPDKSPLGQRIQCVSHFDPDEPWMTVVGVVDDIVYEGISKGPEPAYYLSYPQHAFRRFFPLQINLILRTHVAPQVLMATLREEIRALDPEVPIPEVTTVAETLSSSISREKSGTLLLGVFAGVALLLGIAGVYGVMSYFVSQRIQEIGLRMALGARPVDIHKMVQFRGLALVLTGLTFGLVAAFFLTRLLVSQLYEVNPLDMQTFSFTALILGVVAFFAGWLPARRAAKFDPAITLRYD